MEREEEEGDDDDLDWTPPAVDRKGLSATVGGDSVAFISTTKSGEPLHCVRAGDRIGVRLDVTNACITIEVRGEKMELQLPSKEVGRPLALAIALKYRGDAVSMV
mmetsp:Transcript_59702/g.132989  ORF Transcript_59702/g.132989 Transcript_59702/m.132989 type:complete len:105 (+) Transcript_59702:1190-1504(+)